MVAATWISDRCNLTKARHFSRTFYETFAIWWYSVITDEQIIFGISDVRWVANGNNNSNFGPLKRGTLLGTPDRLFREIFAILRYFVETRKTYFRHFRPTIRARDSSPTRRNHGRHGADFRTCTGRAAICPKIHYCVCYYAHLAILETPTRANFTRYSRRGYVYNIYFWRCFNDISLTTSAEQLLIRHSRWWFVIRFPVNRFKT